MSTFAARLMKTTQEKLDGVSETLRNTLSSEIEKSERKISEFERELSVLKSEIEKLNRFTTDLDTKFQSLSQRQTSGMKSLSTHLRGNIDNLNSRFEEMKKQTVLKTDSLTELSQKLNEEVRNLDGRLKDSKPVSERQFADTMKAIRVLQEISVSKTEFRGRQRQFGKNVVT
jgi:chromosome segregation ATPase